ncbi:kinetochore protein Mis17 [Schizosaccharomyces japonicus yFS275]|uniref:Kinetochore protein Mis17 n=1 Tax=Schizosaccharomyces japonicus (strain yFS275 / FY16936) TaxID=402676 RepID=B6K4Q7_SCHJY|nr:kinetochore protein Mis17 [Schizosaccharomyces japonicus yFS275]EEB08464.2 kinetochore protein Mis17 [Schizosaccharomyces japonicus yFS275]
MGDIEERRAARLRGAGRYRVSETEFALDPNLLKQLDSSSPVASEKADEEDSQKKDKHNVSMNIDTAPLSRSEQASTPSSSNRKRVSEEQLDIPSHVKKSSPYSARQTARGGPASVQKKKVLERRRRTLERSGELTDQLSHDGEFSFQFRSQIAADKSSLQPPVQTSTPLQVESSPKLSKPHSPNLELQDRSRLQSTPIPSERIPSPPTAVSPKLASSPLLIGPTAASLIEEITGHVPDTSQNSLPSVNNTLSTVQESASNASSDQPVVTKEQPPTAFQRTVDAAGDERTPLEVVQFELQKLHGLKRATNALHDMEVVHQYIKESLEEEVPPTTFLLKVKNAFAQQIMLRFTELTDLLDTQSLLLANARKAARQKLALQRELAAVRDERITISQRKLDLRREYRDLISKEKGLSELDSFVREAEQLKRFAAELPQPDSSKAFGTEEGDDCISNLTRFSELFAKGADFSSQFSQLVQASKNMF